MSSAIESSHSQDASSPGPIDAVEWPFERFPPPPLDGNWIPKFDPPPPSKFPLLPSGVPSDLILEPPIMAFTYPPPPPLSLEDPTWLNQMVADVKRQRSHLETCLMEAYSDVVKAYAEAGLADAELEEERAMMQAFLDVVGSVTGEGFVRRMLEDVGDSVQVMSKPEEDDESDDESASSSHPDQESNPSPLPEAGGDISFAGVIASSPGVST